MPQTSIIIPVYNVEPYIGACLDSLVAQTKRDVLREFSLDKWVEQIKIDNDRNYVSTFAKKKIAMRSGETDIAVTVDSSLFESIGMMISNRLKHIANLDVDCIVSEEGDVFVLEMNCRFGGQYPFTHNAGVNIPLQIIKWLNNESTDRNILAQKTGVKSCKELKPVVFE